MAGTLGNSGAGTPGHEGQQGRHCGVEDRIWILHRVRPDRHGDHPGLEATVLAMGGQCP